jgi:arylsulfatase A-like enzyme
MFVGKSKLIGLVHTGSPTTLDIPAGGVWYADTVAAHVLAYLVKANPKPNLMFIHLPDIDIAGHTFGWMSPQYIAAVRHTDSVVTNIWLGLKQAFGSDLVLIVTADHGGSGFGHSDGTPLTRTIPWIAWGRNVSPRTLTTDVRAVDVGPTMLWVLGLTPPTDWDGVPVKSAFPTLVH